MVFSNFCQMFLTAFWAVMQPILAASYRQCFGGTCCFHLSSRGWR